MVFVINCPNTTFFRSTKMQRNTIFSSHRMRCIDIFMYSPWACHRSNHIANHIFLLQRNNNNNHISIVNHFQIRHTSAQYLCAATIYTSICKSATKKGVHENLLEYSYVKKGFDCSHVLLKFRNGNSIELSRLTKRQNFDVMPSSHVTRISSKTRAKEMKGKIKKNY